MGVVILGGGPCGLTAAWDLARNGVKVTVIEKEDAVGGLCKTVRRGPYQFDLGGHRFISSDRALVEDIKNLMGHRLLTRQRKSVIMFKDRQYDYPINISDVIANSSFRENARFLGGYMAGRLKLRKSAAPEGSFERWVDERFGRPLNLMFFKQYTEKLWGVPASNLSSDWAGQRISLISALDAVAKSMLKGRFAPRTYAVSYLYPAGGIGEIFERMRDGIERLGGTVITGARVEKLIIRNGEVRAVGMNRRGADMEVEGSRFLSTIPLDELAQLASTNTADIKLPWRALRFLNITLDGVENLSENTWMYTPDADIIMTRIQEPKRRSPESAPEGRTSVMVEIPCNMGDATWRMEDGALLERVLNDLARLGFNLRRNVTGCFSTCASHAYPRYDMGYRKKVDGALSAISTLRNLDTAGRQGLFKYVFMDTAMLMGRKWASDYLGGSRFEIRMDDNGRAGVIETRSVAA
ncbi:MAG: FAD-dependent oxidoreductase [Nitrospinae bacterium]|nr:FAD-dependent oxidoreductase [Nitrospinota bacterium]